MREKDNCMPPLFVRCPGSPRYHTLLHGLCFVTGYQLGHPTLPPLRFGSHSIRRRTSPRDSLDRLWEQLSLSLWVGSTSNMWRTCVSSDTSSRWHDTEFACTFNAGALLATGSSPNPAFACVHLGIPPLHEVHGLAGRAASCQAPAAVGNSRPYAPCPSQPSRSDDAACPC